MGFTKKDLALLLSSLHSYSGGKAALEQYQTPSELAADALWIAHMQGDVQGKRVADLGCGSGIFGCGALALGARSVLFLDTDRRALKCARENVALLEHRLKKTFSCVFLYKDVALFLERVDTVVQNPPFGVQDEHADRNFLLAAMKARVAYSFHKLETKAFIETFVGHHHKTAVLVKTYTFPLKKTMVFHTKPVYHVDVGLWRIL